MTEVERQNLEWTIAMLTHIKDSYYMLSVRSGNEAFIRLSSVMGELIKIYKRNFDDGTDFITTGFDDLDVRDYEMAYIGEKLEMIFAGRTKEIVTAFEKTSRQGSKASDTLRKIMRFDEK